MVDRKLLRIAVKHAGLTMVRLAEALDMCESTLYRKLNGHSDFYRSEVEKLCKLLPEIGVEDVVFDKNAK